MKFRSRRMFFGVAQVLPVLLAAVVAGSWQRGAEPRPQMSEELFKNVQVLKGIPVDEFMETMGFFSASLGLNCVDCHTRESEGNWAHYADETPLKQTARRMIQM